MSGTWTVDTSVGSFADYTSAWAGFRVNEVLQNIGDAEAIGRTPDVDGQLTIDGTTLQSGTIAVDLTTIRSNQARRDPAIQRSLETGSFPTATFELTKPVDFGGVPADGQTVTVDATGDLTIHGTTKELTIPLQAQVVNGRIAVVGLGAPHLHRLRDHDADGAGRGLGRGQRHHRVPALLQPLLGLRAAGPALLSPPDRSPTPRPLGSPPRAARRDATMTR